MKARFLIELDAKNARVRIWDEMRSALPAPTGKPMVSSNHIQDINELLGFVAGAMFGEAVNYDEDDWGGKNWVEAVKKLRKLGYL